jgi:hypothetical protein
MLAEFLKALEATHARAIKAEVLGLPGYIRSLYLSQGGALQEVQREKPGRCNELLDLSQIPRMIALYALTNPAVFVCQDSVRLMLDTQDRFEVCTLILESTQQWRSLQDLDGAPMDPPQLRRILMFELWGLLPTTLASSLLRVDFARREGATGLASHGVESLGRTIEARAQGMDSIPESVRVTFAPWRRIPVEVSLELGIILDVKAGGIGLRPLAGQVEEAADLAGHLLAQEMQDVLAASGCSTPVIRGTAT